MKGFIEHSMRLYEEPFRLVSNSTKTVEVRLNDEKRQAVQIGDFIEFTNLATGEQVKVKVGNVKVYDSFQALLQHYSNKEVGFSDEIQLSQKLASIYQIYNQTDELHLGALAIEIHLVP
ncbi:ASCH domain-containing protein [Staphylococcus saprophyticus]|uniref:ASCH domain-containing protein n=1 Tax=Staphylococcus saprophyticus TaxID=29385 RepID=UPI000A9406FD|nr:ASCH domain-containing protein [Staphylococcus saprophyticus]MBZ6446419.1 ASCH domain-containing protein [Staphylococcus saprophyticus]MDW3790268.1 ASCH domain-containing protein [Staphylococcus saprophyticus]MDW3805389.1 ASCH domain-containing protein [Staphylococcus saprophyticus]MDW3873313.1 ASCH domain-containing protein [Staphylococcus saprophyticus]MDW3912371.1 ASCH domain-containing protein [Staphylococcus saprophyticus]